MEIPRKIILVDDKPAFRKAMIVLLNKIGNVEIVAEANNGREFLDLLNSHTPDVIFMDIEMPDIDGIEATRQAIAKYPDLIIIGLSMYDSEKYIDELLKAGARGYLLKLSDNTNIFKQILNYPTNEIFFSKEIDPKNREKEKKTIMIADDFENTRYVIEFTLKQQGYEVIKAIDGKDALRQFDGRKIDLLITDYNMPKMDGVTLAGEVRKLNEYAQIPILMLTTEADREKKERAKLVRVTGWIQKPFVMDRFVAIVEKALR